MIFVFGGGWSLEFNNPISGAVLFYATHFEVYPDDPHVDVWPQIIYEFQTWLLDKEANKIQKRRKKNESIVFNLDQITRWKVGYMNSAFTCWALKDSLITKLEHKVANKQIARKNTMKLDQNFLGKEFNEFKVSRSEKTEETVRIYNSFTNECSLQMNESFLQIATVRSEEDSCLHWAMNYDERDSKYWWRKWHTRVGVSASEIGTYYVTVQVLFSIDPTYLSSNIMVPDRNVPKCVRNLLELDGAACISGEDPFVSYPMFVEKEQNGITYTFVQFYEDLIKDIRNIPFVVVTSDSSGRLPADVELLAKELMGIAIVVVLDESNDAVRTGITDYFYSNNTHKEFGPSFYSIRIYFPKLDINDPSTARKHYKFPRNNGKQNLASISKEIANRIISSLTRSFSYPKNTVSSCLDIERIVDNQRREELARKYRELATKTKQLQQSGSHQKENQQTIEDLTRSFNQKRSVDENRIEKLETMLQDMESELSEKRDETVLFQEYISLLEKDNDRLKEDLTQANHAKESAEKEKDSLNWRNQSLIDQLKSRGRKANINVLGKVPAQLPQSTCDVLKISADLFQNNLVILKEAWQSAEEFDGDYNEVWKILVSLAQTLYPLVFDEHENNDFLEEYRSREGFEISLRETKATKDDARLRNARKVLYNGKEIDITPHVKGKTGSKGKTLRVHFYIDHENEKIVIGHCGPHLKTAGTKRKGL